MSKKKQKRAGVSRKLDASGSSVERFSVLRDSPAPVSFRWTFGICILLALLTLLLYSKVKENAFTNFDDAGYVTENQHVRAGLTWETVAWALTATEQGNWHPLTWLSHALDSQLYGMEPGGHHITSVLWHALNAVLLFWLLARVTGWVGRSAVVAALFAVHPLNVESVAWVAERKNVLSMFFFLLALGAYGWYARRPEWKRYGMVAVLYVLGLASKPMVITLPCVLLLLDYWPLGRAEVWSTPSTAFPVPQRTWPQLMLEKAPLLALSAASAIITVVAQQSGSALVPEWYTSFPARVENAIYSYARYVQKTFWPVSLAALYPHPHDKLTFVRVALSALFLIVVTALVWRARVKRPYLVTGWLWFLGTMVPVIGLIQVGSQGMADRYAYLPLIGLFLMLVWTVADWVRARSRSIRVTTAAITAVILLMLGVLTFQQITYWRSSYDLWSHALEVTQDNYMADDYVGYLLYEQGDQQWPRYFEAAAKIAPGDFMSHSMLGGYLMDNGDFEGAIRNYEVVLRGRADNVQKAKVYWNLGILYRRLGNYAKARENSEEALLLDPNTIHARVRQLSEMAGAHPSADLYVQLGLSQEGAGQIAEAESAYEKALQLNPNFGPAQKALEGLRESSH